MTPPSWDGGVTQEACACCCYAAEVDDVDVDEVPDDLESEDEEVDEDEEDFASEEDEDFDDDEAGELLDDEPRLSLR